MPENGSWLRESATAWAPAGEISHFHAAGVYRDEVGSAASPTPSVLPDHDQPALRSVMTRGADFRTHAPRQTATGHEVAARLALSYDLGMISAQNVSPRREENPTMRYQFGAAKSPFAAWRRRCDRPA